MQSSCLLSFLAWFVENRVIHIPEFRLWPENRWLGRVLCIEVHIDFIAVTGRPFVEHALTIQNLCHHVVGPGTKVTHPAPLRMVRIRIGWNRNISAFGSHGHKWTPFPNFVDGPKGGFDFGIKTRPTQTDLLLFSVIATAVTIITMLVEMGHDCLPEKVEKSEGPGNPVMGFLAHRTYKTGFSLARRIDRVWALV